MRNSTFISLLLICLFHTTLTAQNKVRLSGTVKDTEGNPLPQITVALYQSATGTYTNNEGKYSLLLSPGTHTVVLSQIGYNTLTTEVTLKNDKQQDFVLEENIIALNSVEVYGKSQTQQTREGVFAVNALDVKPIVNTSASLSNIVNRTTSVRVREEGGVGSDFKLSINGLSGNSIRYFIDGIPLSALGGGITLSNLPVSMIDRIEIYKGVVPTHLGADALGGAINIITNQEKQNYIDASYGTGSFHTHKTEVSGQFRDKKTGFTVRPLFSLNYSKNDYTMRDMEIWDEEERVYKEKDVKRFHDDYLSIITKLEAGFTNRRWADAFLFSATMTKRDKDIQTGSVQTKVYGEARQEKESLNTALQYRKKDFLTEKLDVNLLLSHTWDNVLTIDTAFRTYMWDGTYMDTNRNEMNQRGRSLRHTKQPLTLFRSNINYSLHPHHSVNVNYLMNSLTNDRWDELDSEVIPSKDLITRHIIGASYNQNLLNDRLNNTLFYKQYINRLKVEQQDLYWITGSDDMKGTSTSSYYGYGIGSRYIFHELASLKASYERTTRLPDAREYLGNGSTSYPNFKLQPEKSNNYNIGVYGTWQQIPNHLLYYEAGVFLRHVKDYIRYQAGSGANGIGQYENVNNVTAKGFEAEVKYEYRDLFQLLGNISYQESRSKTKYYADGSPQITYNNKIPNEPWLYSNIQATLSKKDLFVKRSRIDLNYYYQYVHWFYLTWEGYGSLESKAIIPTQHMHNVVLTYSLQNEKYNISLECNNLTDRVLYDNYKLQKPGRSFFCKFRLFIN